jgi:acyl-CoA dehydrogenase
MTVSSEAFEMATRVEAFVRERIFPYDHDPRRDHHGAPTDELVMEMRELARDAGVLTPYP